MGVCFAALPCVGATVAVANGVAVGGVAIVVAVVSVANVAAKWATARVAPTLMLQCHCFGAVITVGSS
jgi:hypothetical protein